MISFVCVWGGGGGGMFVYLSSIFFIYFFQLIATRKKIGTVCSENYFTIRMKKNIAFFFNLFTTRM